MKRYPKSVYMRRRMMACAIVIVAFWAMVHVAYAIVTEPDYVCEPFTHVADSGDSLWSIGELYCKGDMLALRYDMVRANGGTHIIHPNQIVTNPKGG